MLCQISVFFSLGGGGGPERDEIFFLGGGSLRWYQCSPQPEGKIYLFFSRAEDIFLEVFYYWSFMDSRCIFMAYGVILKQLEVGKTTWGGGGH
jgi:hypothetical protein